MIFGRRTLLSGLLMTIALHATAADFCDALPVTTDLVKVGDKQVPLEGVSVKAGQQAPNFDVVDGQFRRVSLSDFRGKTVLLSVVPSLDTGVCSLQTKRFNESVADLPQDVVILTISTDLPFAQKRFCKVENIDKVQVLSDAVWRNFGASYGLLIKDMGLLARAIFIIDSEQKVVYREIVEQLSEHPNYDSALAKLKETIATAK